MHVVPKRRGSKYADILLQRLQNNLLVAGEPVVIGMVSHAPRQGVTTTATNLAIRAADHYFKPALMIDGNCKNQKISKIYRSKGAGLMECLNGHVSLDSCVARTKIPDCFVLGAGDKKHMKQIMIDHDLASEFFKAVRNDFKFTVIDLPPLNEPSYVESILPLLDGVVLVAKYGVRRERLATTQQFLKKANTELIAAVMTGNDDRLPGWVPNYFG